MNKPLFIVLLIGIVSFANAQTAKEFEEMADKKMEAKDYQYAMVLINKAITLDTKNQWLLLQKAEIQYKLTGPREAITIAQSAIKLDRKNAECYNRIGSYYNSGGLIDSAIIMFNQAIQYAKTDTAKNSYLMNRGAAKLGMRDFEGAIKDFESVLAFDATDLGSLINISSCYGELGRSAECIATLKKAIALDPTFAGSYGNLGFMYSDMDSLDLALYYFNKVLELEPTDAVAFNNRGYIQYKKGNYAGALSDINLSIKTYPTNAYAYRNLALVYIAQKKMKEACTALSYAQTYGFEQTYGSEVSQLLEQYCKK
jgi:tetratricopeptide (TPR) repeat protein